MDPRRKTGFGLIPLQQRAGLAQGMVGGIPQRHSYYLRKLGELGLSKSYGATKVLAPHIFSHTKVIKIYSNFFARLATRGEDLIGGVREFPPEWLKAASSNGNG